MSDPYEVCRHVRHYQAKNGYAPVRSMLGCEDAFIDQLVKNGILELVPNREGGPKIYVVLTDKGLRMAQAKR